MKENDVRFEITVGVVLISAALICAVLALSGRPFSLEAHAWTQREATT